MGIFIFFLLIFLFIIVIRITIGEPCRVLFPTGLRTLSDYGPIIVSMKHYFVSGDNRDNSLNSYYIGFIPEENVVGKVNLVLCSFDPSNIF